MDTIITEITKDFSFKCASQEEGILREVIAGVLGEGFTMEEAQKRITAVKFQNAEETVFCIDGKPVIELHPPKIETVRDGDGYKLKATQAYRLLS